MTTVKACVIVYPSQECQPTPFSNLKWVKMNKYRRKSRCPETTSQTDSKTFSLKKEAFLVMKRMEKTLLGMLRRRWNKMTSIAAPPMTSKCLK